MYTYNPYQNTQTSQSLFDDIISNNPTEQTFLGRRLSKLSLFGRNYDRAVLMNAKGIHKYEDKDANLGTDYKYSIFSRKSFAMMQERQNIAALNAEYYAKLPILQEYSTKGEIRDVVTKLANEVVVYNKNKKFCEIADFPSTYSALVKKRSKELFESIYTQLGFTDRTFGWDMFRDFLVEGFICKEIIYDQRKKNIIGFQSLDAKTIFPYTDPKTGIHYWIQNATDQQKNVRVFQDAEIIYISYSGSSNYMETSYVEPLIKPYNELKNIERAKLQFNLINATMHKKIVIPTHGMSPAQAEQELLTLISDYKDNVQFDDSTGITYIDGSKDLPWSKEVWLTNDGESEPTYEIVNPEGANLNEDTTLIWFRNNFKLATKFPLTRFDATSGGGNIYSYGAEVSYDDYNFNKFVARLRAIYKEILLKPISSQLLLEFPELEDNEFFLNDLDITFYGHSEIEKAKELANWQAKATIANDLMNNFKRNDDTPVLHWKLVAKHVMELSDELMQENDKYWKLDTINNVAQSGGGSTASPTDNTTGGGDNAQPSTDNAQPNNEETPPPAQPEVPES